jgi:Rieske Fe-S protein
MALLGVFSFICRLNQTTFNLGITNKNISRKRFFKWAGLAALVPLAKIWHEAVDSKQAFSKRERELIITKDLPDGIHFFEGVILVKQNGKFNLLSAKCTHLGCRIDKMENELLVCPCHGSKYDFQGKPVLGPAARPLAEFNFQIEEKDGSYLIRYKV